MFFGENCTVLVRCDCIYKSGCGMERYSVRPEALERDYPHPVSDPPTPRIGSWVYLGYYVPAGLMPAEDLERYRKSAFEGEPIYQCVNDDGALVTVRNNTGREYRVNPNRVIWLPAPRFRLGDKVRTKVDVSRIGWIVERGWHLKKRQMCYWIDRESHGRRKKHRRRYRDDELEPFEMTSPAAQS
jgi:hypothetical protein